MEQCEQVRRLARERLADGMLTDVLDAVIAAENARVRRNEVVHQDWLLRGRDTMRPVSELEGNRRSAWLRSPGLIHVPRPRWGSRIGHTAGPVGEVPASSF